MYQLHSQWTVDQELARSYDPDRLHGTSARTRPTAAGTDRGRGQRAGRLIDRIRSAVIDGLRRGSLGPVCEACGTDRVAQWR